MKKIFKDDKKMFLLLIAFTIGIEMIYYLDLGCVNYMNTTIYAFSYKYGFISRGLIGSLFNGLCGILGKTFYTYRTIQMISYVTLFGFILLFIFLFWKLLSETPKEQLVNAKNYIFLCTVVLFPIFMDYENFGRTDVIMAIISIICGICIVKDRFAFIIPLTIMGTMIHQGYVLMFYAIVVGLLFYKIITDSTKRKYAIAVFIIDIIIVFGLCVYFECFSHVNGQESYQQVVDDAISLSYDGQGYHVDVVAHEILGEDVSYREREDHINNFRELIFFILLFMPFIVITIQMIRKVIIFADKTNRWMYFMISLGSFAILPDLLFKTDYGRYLYTMIFYYIVMLIFLLIMKDATVTKSFHEISNKINEKNIYPFLVIVLVIFQPFRTVKISTLTDNALTYFMMVLNKFL